MGLSHTISFYQPAIGIEKVFDSLLRKGTNVQLTIDDDLQRIARSEVLKEIEWINRKKEYRLSALQNELNMEDNKIVAKMIKNQINTIEKNSTSGALIILNQSGEILSAVSEPSAPLDMKAINKAFELAQLNPDNNLLINKAIFQPQWSPGSSMKLLTAIAALEVQKQNPWIEGVLKGNHCLNGHKSGLLDSFTLPNGKRIISNLSNFKRKKVIKEMSDLSGALAKSYIVYFGYLGLLMSKTIMSDSNMLNHNDRFWWRSFADISICYADNPLLKIAEIVGYNRYLNLMPVSHKKLQKMEYINEYFFCKPGIFPQVNLSQIALTRNAIGQGQVRTTPLLNAIISLMIAQNGKLTSVSLIKQVYSGKDEEKEELFCYRPESKQVLKTDTKLTRLKRGMNWVVNGKQRPLKKWEVNKLSGSRYGTAVATFNDSILKHYLYGKTGTSEAGVDGQDGHSWFVCFIKLPNEKIYSIAAVFPYGGSGSRHAAECVKRILNKMNRYYEWSL